jgi:PAS domain S-box-containing protein
VAAESSHFAYNAAGTMSKSPVFLHRSDLRPVAGCAGQADECVVIRRQLAFEILLTDLTAKFVDLAADRVDAEIDRGLREIAEFVGVDRTTLMQFSPDGTQLRRVNGYARAGIDPAPGIVASEQFPWYTRQLRAGVTLVLRRLPDDLPAEAIAARCHCAEEGLKSHLAIPLQIGDTVVAAIAFGMLTRFFDWPDEMIPRLRLLGKVFADALTHQRANAALRDSEQRFRTVADFCYDWEYWLAPDEQLLYVSPSCERITGYRPEEFLADAGLLERIVHAEDRPAFAEHLRSNLAAEPRGMDVRIVTRIGKERWISHQCQPVYGSQGEYLGRRASNRDITDRKEMELQVQKAAAEWRTTFNSVRDVVTVLDRDMRIVQVNAAAAAFMGHPPDQILGQFCHVLMHGTDAPLAKCPFSQALHSQQRAEAEVFDPHRDAWLAVAIDPVVDARGEAVRFIHTAKDITERKRSQLDLEHAYHEIQQLKERLERDNLCLREQTQPTALPSGIVGGSPALLRVLEQARQVARANSTVLISGETGTGKELVAAAIHELSPRSHRVMVRVNCAALPATLIESELFGREKGAYTGALTAQLGRFELANGSTIFLDEVGELPLELQAKLLRVLQESRFERLGNPQTIQVDVRVIAASNRDLAQAVREGKFREDLFYRLNVFPLHVPPLRERPEDLPALVWSFAAEFGKLLGKTIEAIPQSTMEALQRYRWPGNVRELRNVVERAVILCEGPELQIELPVASSTSRPRACRLEDVEREHILEVLEQTSWRVRGLGGAAELLDVRPTTLESRMAKLGIRRGGKPSDIS